MRYLKLFFILYLLYSIKTNVRNSSLIMYFFNSVLINILIDVDNFVFMFNLLYFLKFIISSLYSSSLPVTLCNDDLWKSLKKRPALISDWSKSLPLTDPSLYRRLDLNPSQGM